MPRSKIGKRTQQVAAALSQELQTFPQHRRIKSAFMLMLNFISYASIAKTTRMLIVELLSENVTEAENALLLRGIEAARKLVAAEDAAEKAERAAEETKGLRYIADACDLEAEKALRNLAAAITLIDNLHK